jgi:hypothetical protein
LKIELYKLLFLKFFRKDRYYNLNYLTKTRKKSVDRKFNQNQLFFFINTQTEKKKRVNRLLELII